MSKRRTRISWWKRNLTKGIHCSNRLALRSFQTQSICWQSKLISNFANSTLKSVNGAFTNTLTWPYSNPRKHSKSSSLVQDTSTTFNSKICWSLFKKKSEKRKWKLFRIINKINKQQIPFLKMKEPLVLMSNPKFNDVMRSFWSKMRHQMWDLLLWICHRLKKRK